MTPGTNTTGMLGSMYDYDQVDYGLDAYVEGKFDAFGQRHELLLGMNASRSNKDDFYSVAFLTQRQDVFNPDKFIPEPDDSYFIDNSSRGGPVKSVTKQRGMYSTLRLRLADPLTLVVGGRVSWYDSETDSVFINSGTSEHSSAKETGQVTPFAGVLLDLDENLTAYASYSDIFTPQGNYRSEDGSALKPLVGQSYELGIKGAWFDGRLNSAFNLFRTIQKDQARPISTRPARPPMATATSTPVGSGRKASRPRSAVKSPSACNCLRATPTPRPRPSTTSTAASMARRSTAMYRGMYCACGASTPWVARSRSSASVPGSARKAITSVFRPPVVQRSSRPVMPSGVVA